MNTAAKNAALMDQSIELTKRMMGGCHALNARLTWLGFSQLWA
jgi:hypothetical protein